MKKILLMTVVALILVFIVAGVASANGGPHGGYTPTTDACAGCHRAHTAAAPRLLVQDAATLCLNCHGSAGLGANTNVDDGFYLSTRDDPPGGADGNVGAANTPDNAPLLGGGFVNYGGVAVTSTHDPTGATDQAWGNGVNRGVAAALTAGNLNCASCHDPHGTTTYRIIKENLNGQAVTAAQVDEAAKDYDTEQWGAGMSSICAACHGAYHTTAGGVGSDPVEAANGGYTHRIDVAWDGDATTPTYVGAFGTNPETVGLGGFTLPLAESGTNDMLVCMTCHFPHGTAAAANGFASGTFDPAGPLGPIPAGDSSLLRLDNRGVCEVCHQK